MEDIRDNAATIDTVRLTYQQLLDHVLRLTEQLPEDAREETAKAITEEILTDPDAERGPLVQSLLHPEKYYVVPGADLRFADSAVLIATGISALYQNPVPIITSLCLLAFQFYRLSIELNQNEGLIVLVLKDPRWRDEGQSIEEIEPKLPRRLELSRTQIAEILKGLQEKHTRGKPTPVVHEWHDRWYAPDIW